MKRLTEHQLVLFGGEQLVYGLAPSEQGHGDAGADAEAGEDGQEGEEGGEEPLGVQGGWW